MRKKQGAEREDLSCFLVRNKVGHYLTRRKGVFQEHQAGAYRLRTRKKARELAKKYKGRVVRLIVRVSEEEG